MAKLIFPNTDFDNLYSIIKTKKDLERQIKNLTNTDIRSFIEGNRNTMQAGLATSVVCEHLEEEGYTEKLEEFLKEIELEKFGFLGYKGEILCNLEQNQGHFANVENAYFFNDNAGKNILVQGGMVSDFRDNSGENAIFKIVHGSGFYDDSLNNAKILDNSMLGDFYGNAGETLHVEDSKISDLKDNSCKNIFLDNSLLSKLYNNSAQNVIAKNYSEITETFDKSVELIRLYDSNFSEGCEDSCKNVYLNNSTFKMAFGNCGRLIKAINGSEIYDIYDLTGKEIYLCRGTNPSFVVPNGKQKIFTINNDCTPKEVKDYEIGERFYV